MLEACDAAAAQAALTTEPGHCAGPGSSPLRASDPPTTSAASPSSASCSAHLQRLGPRAVRTCRLLAARRPADSGLMAEQARATATATAIAIAVAVAVECCVAGLLATDGLEHPAKRQARKSGCPGRRRNVRTWMTAACLLSCRRRRSCSWCLSPCRLACLAPSCPRRQQQVRIAGSPRRLTWLEP